MFTGIVEEVGEVVAVEASGPGRRLRIASRFAPDGFGLGDSVAVDGACLTVTALGRGTFDVDASHETVARTTVGELRAGRRVHLERALRVGDRLGGHFVTGHVDARGQLSAKRRNGEAFDLEFALPVSLAPQIVAKGSIAVDGVSLTVNTCRPGAFSVTVIPFTIHGTTLLDRAVGAAVNLETDLLGKYVAHLVTGGGKGAEEAPSGGLEDALRRQGFL